MVIMKRTHYHQLDAMDCGAASLRIVASHYGRHFSQKHLRELCHITRNGVSLLGISDAAEAIGFRTIGVKISWQQLIEDATLPCIIHWNQRHFVVVLEIQKKKHKTIVVVSDPAEGILKYDEEAFKKAWLQIDGNDGNHLGAALLLAPKPEFFEQDADKKDKVSLWDLLAYIRPYGKYIFYIAFALLSASLISLVFPFLTQAIVDTGIQTKNVSFIIIILIAQLLLTAGQMSNNIIRSWLMLHVTTRIGITYISDFIGKMMRLPIAFFDSKNIGDILQRIKDFNRVQTFLTGTLISTTMSLIIFIIYTIVMATYNGKVLAAFLVGSISYVVWVQVFMKRRRKLDYMQFQEMSNNQSNLIQLVNGMQEIKLNNCEKAKRWEWEEIQARLFRISSKSLALGQIQNNGGGFIDEVKNITISFLSALAVINGNMTIGEMMALQYIIGQLNAPLYQFIGFMQSLQDAKMSVERMGEITGKDDEECPDRDYINDIPQSADIELKNVVFQYDGPRSSKVLNNLSLVIPGGKITAIVGVSGSGKTTLLKMLLGFYSPASGEIMLGNQQLNRFRMSNWRAACGVVMQDGFIFSDTIEKNISISNDESDHQRVLEAARKACVHDFVESLPTGYHTKIGADGHGLSSGQKQRILIARAIYKDASYIILDEATNSLDANNEKEIIKNLNEFFAGKTVIIVAHRLSTIQNADNIIVLEKGAVVEQGSQQELVSLHGVYYNLIKNQLEFGN